VRSYVLLCVGKGEARCQVREEERCWERSERAVFCQVEMRSGWEQVERVE
jgi:hypothetical protein